MWSVPEDFPEELKSYQGPKNYISIVEAFKPGPLSSTPLRLCMNSSLKFKGRSLNDILMKGPAALNELLRISLGFRQHPVAIVMDLEKFYQSVNMVERDQHVCRILWRDCIQEAEPQIYKTMTVNFGDKPAGTITQCARAYMEVNPEAAKKIIDKMYVDDTITGASSVEEAKKMADRMRNIAGMGGFNYKETIISGYPAEEERKVLGLGWNSEDDTVQVKVNVNWSGKRKRAKQLPDADLQTLEVNFPDPLSKRMVWRIILAQYDLLGLISAFTVCLKLFMKLLAVGEGFGVGQSCT